ncbi:unnamed protein product, partial [Staurois parvus]
MQGPGRPDIVNAGSGENRYSECRVRELSCLWMVPSQQLSRKTGSKEGYQCVKRH